MFLYWEGTEYDSIVQSEKWFVLVRLQFSKSLASHADICLVITFLRYALAVVWSVTDYGNAVGPGSSFLEEAEAGEFFEEAEVDKLGVQTGVELAVETEVDRPNVGAGLVVGTGAGETEVG